MKHFPLIPLISVISLISVIPLAAAAQQRRPITVQDFLRLERPAEPAISPDGRWVWVRPAGGDAAE